MIDLFTAMSKELAAADRARDVEEICARYARALGDHEAFTALTTLAFERARLLEEAQLLTAVSHDLKAPLTSIRGSAEVLLADRALSLEPEERIELLEEIRAEADRLARLVSNLLDLSRLESGAARVSKAAVPLEDLIGSALERMRGSLQGRRVDIDLPAEIVLIPADPVLLEQALIHVLENAAKYSPPASAINVIASRREKEIDIEILDRGPGLPPGDEMRVFEKFYRGSNETPGAGLGLTVCRAIIRAHGGTIRAANRAEGGARFTITLEVA